MHLVEHTDAVFSVPRLAGCTAAQGYAACCHAQQGAACPQSRLPRSPDAPEVMANVEVWKIGKELIYDQWVTMGRVVRDVGPLGVIGRDGWFTTKDFVEDMWSAHRVPADHWRALTLREILRQFEQPLSNPAVVEAARGLCVDGRGPAEAGCVDGWFFPPPCNVSAGGDPAWCATIYSTFPGLAPGTYWPVRVRVAGPGALTSRVPRRHNCAARHEPAAERFHCVRWQPAVGAHHGQAGAQ